MRNTHISNPDIDEVTSRPESRATRAVAEKAHQTVDKMADRAASAETNVRAAASASGEKLAHGKEEAEAKVNSAMDDVNAFVRDNPLASTGLAFAAGALLTTLMRRSS